MAVLRTLTLLAAVASSATPILALPNAKAEPGAANGPTLHIRGDDAMPTIIRPRMTPAAHMQQRDVDSSSAVDAESTPEALPEEDLCVSARCDDGAVCEVSDGKAQCVDGIQCGPTVCGAGLVCCNETCGICAEPDGACIMLFCGEVERL